MDGGEWKSSGVDHHNFVTSLRKCLSAPRGSRLLGATGHVHNNVRITCSGSCQIDWLKVCSGWDVSGKVGCKRYRGRDIADIVCEMCARLMHVLIACARGMLPQEQFQYGSARSTCCVKCGSSSVECLPVDHSGDVVLDIHDHVLIPLHHTPMYVFFCAAAKGDGRIGTDRLNFSTYLSLVLLVTSRVSRAVCKCVRLWLSSTALAVQYWAVACGSTTCRRRVAATGGGTVSSPTAICSSVSSTRRWLHCHATTTSVPTATSASVASHCQPTTCSTNSSQRPTSSLPHLRLPLRCHRCSRRHHHRRRHRH